MSQRRLAPGPAERAELIRLRDHAPKPYLRECAAVVARERLLRRRKADTVYDWLNRFERGGVEALRVRPGRGRKPAFSPSLP